MEEYFKTTIEKMRYSANKDRMMQERELLALRQKIAELEDKVKHYEEEKRRIMND